MSSSKQISTLQKFIKFSGSVSGLDKEFRLVSYGLKMVLYFYKGGPSELYDNLQQLSIAMGEARYTLRLTNLASTFQDLINFKEADPLLRPMRFMQHLSMLYYYPFDHAYYFCLRGLFPSVSEETKKFISRNASRGWLVYVVLDIFVDLRKLTLENTNRLKAKSVNGNVMTTTQISEDSANYEAKIQGIYLNLLSNFLNLPMALEWSLQEGFLPEIGIPAFGLLGSILSFYIKWSSLTSSNK